MVWGIRGLKGVSDGLSRYPIACTHVYGGIEMRGLKAVFVALVLALPILLAPVRGRCVSEGEQAPVVTLFGVSGEFINTYEYKNSMPLILSFFYVPCPPCEKEIPEIQRIQNDNPGIKVILIADRNSDAAKSREFMKKISDQSGVPISLQVGLDCYGDTTKLFRVKQHPTTVLIDKKGKVVLRVEGYSEEKAAALKNAVSSTALK